MLNPKQLIKRRVTIAAWIVTVLAVVAMINWAFVGFAMFGGATFDIGLLAWLPKYLAALLYIIIGIGGIALIPLVVAMIWLNRR